MKRSEGSPLGLYTVGVAALFLAGFFLLVVFGAQSYRDTAAGQNENMQTRALLAYLSATVKANDSENAVRVEHTADGPMLIVGDGDSGYGLRIYAHEGRLLEEFARLDSRRDPGGAQVIGETDRFEVERLSDSLLAVETDAGRVLLRLRSEGGDAE